MLFGYDVGACALLPAFNDEHIHPTLSERHGFVR